MPKQPLVKVKTVVSSGGRSPGVGGSGILGSAVRFHFFIQVVVPRMRSPSEKAHMKETNSIQGLRFIGHFTYLEGRFALDGVINLDGQRAPQGMLTTK